MERLTEKQKHILQQKLCDMKNRCYNTSNKFYKDYGGRGITVCDEWQGKDGHKNFQKWALESGWQEGYSIDRIDVNGNYEPSNCRWADAKEQANNRRNNIPVTINGVTKNATEWAEEIGISERAFMSRIKYGWSEDRLLEPKYKPLKMSKAEMSKEIREWRKLEEQGLLLRLPCKVGTTYWTFDTQYWIEEEKCKGCSYYFDCDTDTFCDCDEDYPKCMQVIDEVFLNNLQIISLMNQFGKTVFLTKEEAEKKLAEMRKG